MKHGNLNTKVDAVELDSCAYDLKCAIDIVSAIQRAEEVPDTPDKSYTDALYGAYRYLCTVYQQFEKAIYIEEADA